MVSSVEPPIIECESQRQVSGVDSEWRRTGGGGSGGKDSGTKVLGAASWGKVHAWLSGTGSPWDGACS